MIPMMPRLDKKNGTKISKILMMNEQLRAAGAVAAK